MWISVCVIFCVYMHACVRACRGYVVTRIIEASSA